MTNDDENQPTEEQDDQPTGPLFRTLITGECYAPLDADAPTYIRQSTVLTHRLLEVLISMHTLIQQEAPILMARSAVGWAVATLGRTLQNAEEHAVEWMEANGIEPLNLRAEEVRVAEAGLADPDLPEGMREQLEAIIAEAAPDGLPTEWPDVVSTGPAS